MGYTFVVSVISIMLSTIDSFIMGISFTYTYDYSKVTRDLVEQNENLSKRELKFVLNRGRLFSITCVLVAFGLFVFFDINISGGGGLFINLLLTFYSGILSLLAIVLGMVLFEKKVRSGWALASAASGAVLGIGVGIYAVLYDATLAWYPVIISLLISALVYLIGILANGFFDRKISTA